MKVYVGNRNINDESFKIIKDVQLLGYMAEDCECTSIVLDHALKQYKLDSLVGVVDNIVKKLRIGANLIINEVDFDLLVFSYNNNPDIIGLNNMVSNLDGFKCLLTFDLIKQLMSRYSNLSLTSSASNGLEFTLEYKRQS